MEKDKLTDPIAFLGDANDRANGQQSAASRTLESLRNRIIYLELKPDTVLSRADLAQEYNVSITPLRDALQKLETEGLVEIFPQSKTVVTRIDSDEIAEAVFLRRSIEIEIVRHLAENADESVIARLKSIISMQEAIAESTGEIGSFQQLDKAFHKTMIYAAGYPGLHKIIRARTGDLNRLRFLDMWDDKKIRQVIADHKAIVAAIEAHDPEKAVASVRHHLSQTISRLNTLRNKHPDFFRN